MEKDLTSITIQVPVKLKRALEDEARRLTISVSAIIRQQVSFFLDEDATNVALKEGKKTPKTAKNGHSR